MRHKNIITQQETTRVEGQCIKIKKILLPNLSKLKITHEQFVVQLISS